MTTALFYIYQNEEFTVFNNLIVSLFLVTCGQNNSKNGSEVIGSKNVNITLYSNKIFSWF